MDIIHADKNLAELGYIIEIDGFDAEISQEIDAEIERNSFALTLADTVWSAQPVEIGHYIYSPDTEFGGMVEKIQHSTARQQITVSGVTWRGMLHRKIIVPASGQDYLTITAADANAAINTIVDGSLGTLFGVSASASGITIANKKFRYTNMLTGIEDMLEEEGAALEVAFDQSAKSVTLSARAVVNYSATIDLSQDYGVDMVTTEGGFDRYNHIIALGAGELADRDIVHIYRLADGSMTTVAPAWAGTVDDYVTTYDYNNPETIAILQKGAEERAAEYAPLNQVEIDPAVDGLDLKLGDIVGARDRLTGMAGTAVIVGRILTMNAGGIKLETRVK
ncbi:MAG: hypothetical protein PHX74_11140 [Candidatus Sumerlaeales bacterium]|nr:hypothetical protein [Candidatus Sumerlaeales bacterium]